MTDEVALRQIFIRVLRLPLLTINKWVKPENLQSKSFGHKSNFPLSLVFKGTHNDRPSCVLQIAERTELPRAECYKHVTHENPVYSELLRQEKQDRQEVEDEILPEKQLQEVSDLQV